MPASTTLDPSQHQSSHGHLPPQQTRGPRSQARGIKGTQRRQVGGRCSSKTAPETLRRTLCHPQWRGRAPRAQGAQDQTPLPVPFLGPLPGKVAIHGGEVTSVRCVCASELDQVLPAPARSPARPLSVREPRTRWKTGHEDSPSSRLLAAASPRSGAHITQSRFQSVEAMPLCSQRLSPSGRLVPRRSPDPSAVTATPRQPPRPSADFLPLWGCLF